MYVNRQLLGALIIVFVGVRSAPGFGPDCIHGHDKQEMDSGRQYRSERNRRMDQLQHTEWSGNGANSAYVDQSYTLNGTSDLIGSLGFLRTSRFGGSIGGGSAPSGSPFALTQIITLSGPQRGYAGFGATVGAGPAVTALPEPSGLYFLLSGVLLALGTLRFRR